jgi:putative ABC transport system permease protein
MTGRVPLARRNLLADRRRLVASVAGVGLAVMLILLLDGMWTGVQVQSRLYADRAGADLFVLQPGVSDLIAGESVLPASTVDTVARTPGVTRATPVQSTYVILEFHGQKVPTNLVGSVPGAAGGPWVMGEGRAVRTGGEIVVDSLLARRHGLDVGDRMAVMGQPFKIVGMSRESSGFMGVGYVFVTHDAATRLLGATSVTSYVLVATGDPTGVARRLAAQGLNVLTKEQAGSNTEDLFTGVFGGPLGLMVAVAFAAGTLVIALTAYTAVAERRREYGIVKAMGATRRTLIVLALGQTLVLAALGLVTGGVLFAAGRELIAAASPQFLVVVTAPAAVRAAAAALSMALVAAMVPARRLARLDPASAYRGS